MLRFLEGLVGRSSAAALARMGSFVIIMPHPLIQIGLQLLHRVVDHLVKRHLVELFLNGVLEPFTNAIGRRVRAFGQER